MVLEFWATWCAPCIEALPRINALVDSVDRKNIQFISVTDEDLLVVRKFLSKRKIAGLVAIDGHHSVFAKYGVTEPPKSIVIDPSGRIVEVTTTEQLDAGKLSGFLHGESHKWCVKK